MNPGIHPLLVQAEGKTLEFKRDLSSPQNALKTLVAFASSAGGRLVIGVDDARRVAGVADPLAEEERICNLITDSIAPRLIPNVELMSIGDATVLIEYMPAARLGDQATCLGPPDMIATGAATCLIGYMPAARVGDTTVHGGSIVVGCTSVLIGD